MDDALREVSAVRQVSGELRRRWFTSQTLDLVVWCDAADVPVALQFCYGKGSQERALQWSPEQGYSHRLVDDGETSGGVVKSAPVLGQSLKVDHQLIHEIFTRHGAQLPNNISTFVRAKIDAFQAA